MTEAEIDVLRENKGEKSGRILKKEDRLREIKHLLMSGFNISGIGIYLEHLENVPE